MTKFAAGLLVGAGLMMVFLMVVAGHPASNGTSIGLTLAGVGAWVAFLARRRNDA